LREALDLGPEASVYPQADWQYSDYVTAGVVLSQYTVQSDGRRVYSQFGAETQLNWWGEWLVYLYQMGGTFYTPSSHQRRSALGESEAYEATAFYVRKAMGGPEEKFAPNAIESTQFSFLGGNVAMIFGGHMGDWFSYEALGLNWDVQVLPVPDGRPEARGGEISADAFGISVRSSQKEAAFAFLTLWTGETGALAMAPYGKIGALNAMQDLLQIHAPTGMPDIDYTALFRAAAIAVTLPDEQDFPRLMREVVMAELYRLMYTGRGSETDVALVLERIRQAIDTHYINRYGA
ncbi:MAG: extracellular solute-binding protein, partial [Acholeplasmatales bacterium]